VRLATNEHEKFIMTFSGLLSISFSDLARSLDSSIFNVLHRTSDRCILYPRQDTVGIFNDLCRS